MNLSKEIKTVRQRLFLTQTDFAKRLKVSYATVNRWETGKSRPNLSTMREIKRFCTENDVDYTSVESAWLDTEE